MKNPINTTTEKPRHADVHRRVGGAVSRGRRSGLDILLYAGRFRPKVTPDFAHKLLDGIIAGGHRIVGAIVSQKDPISRRLRRLGVPILGLPQSIDQPLARIKALLRENRAERCRLAAWMDRIASLEPDIGVIFYGSWLPPALFSIPRHGFLNFHPAPLPELRGVEPDTFAILEGRSEVWGTVHLVSEGYDEGPIVERTAKMRLTRYTTPVVVWHKLTDLGITALIRTLHKTHRGTVSQEQQDHRQATDASRDRARMESVIRWKTDGLEMIHRRLLAYSGQDIRIRLKAPVGGNLYCIRDLELHRGDYPGRPGDVLGDYSGTGRFHGQPMVRARGGVAVLELGKAIRDGARDPHEPLARVIPPRRRKKSTAARIVRRSLK
jgi:methionyl-tRNA formyltransferase